MTLRQESRPPLRARGRACAGGRALCVGEGRPSGNRASGTADRQGGRDALQTTGTETGPMTKHDTS